MGPSTPTESGKTWGGCARLVRLRRLGYLGGRYGGRGYARKVASCMKLRADLTEGMAQMGGMRGRRHPRRRYRDPRWAR